MSSPVSSKRLIDQSIYIFHSSTIDLPFSCMFCLPAARSDRICIFHAHPQKFSLRGIMRFNLQSSFVHDVKFSFSFLARTACSMHVRPLKQLGLRKETRKISELSLHGKLFRIDYLFERLLQHATACMSYFHSHNPTLRSLLYSLPQPTEHVTHHHFKLWFLGYERVPCKPYATAIYKR